MAIPKQVLKGPNEILPFDHSAITYPQLASTKFDGFRGLNLCGEHLLSPALKPFPNRNLGRHFEDLFVMCHGARIVTDGEVWSPQLTFQELQSIVRSHDSPIPDHVGYYLFDMMTEEEWNEGTEPEFLQRYIDYKKMIPFEHVIPVEQWHIRNCFEAEDFFNGQLELGNEGMILRQYHARYKHGRATVNQDYLWKFKEFVTHDAMIVGVEEQMRLKEGVERTRNVVGHLERRYEQELYKPAGKVGAFVVKNEQGEFKVKPGKGHNDYIKTSWWQDWVKYPEKWRGKHVEFKHMPHGAMNKPRIGSLVRFRPDLDK